ncbi:MAG: Cell division protein FtsL [Clostridiales bacterium]|jgi:cell division protein FtsL|nr:Cell division protein FtsL [Clostridiales bacterium]MDN5281814.1 Cell division protein FtsL [Candidatus Ozemobacter sp.]
MANQHKILLNTPNSAPVQRTGAREEIQPAMIAKRRQMIRLYLTAILLLSMMFTLYVWQSTKMIEVKLRIKKAEKNISVLENGNSDLRAEISKLQSLARIETVAKNDLGMIVPRKLIYLTMPEGFKQ